MTVDSVTCTDLHWHCTARRLPYAAEVMKRIFPFVEQRRALRLEVYGDVVTRLLAIPHPVQLIDISPAGCLIESMAPLPVGTEHEMAMTMSDGDRMSVVGRVAHCEQRGFIGRLPRYGIGFAFVHSDAQRPRDSIERLIERLTTRLAFD